MNMATIVWLILLVLFLIVEAATVSMVSSWFAGGALVALLVSLIGGPVWLQMLAFFTVSIVLLALLRPVVRKFLKPRLVKTNADSLIGTTCRAIEDIDDMQGRVQVGDVTWSARSEDGTAIAADTGGAIKGNKIDICVNTRAEAYAFGRRTVDVYIL